MRISMLPPPTSLSIATGQPSFGMAANIMPTGYQVNPKELSGPGVTYIDDDTRVYRVTDEEPHILDTGGDATEVQRLRAKLLEDLRTTQQAPGGRLIFDRKRPPQGAFIDACNKLRAAATE